MQARVYAHRTVAKRTFPSHEINTYFLNIYANTYLPFQFFNKIFVFFTFFLEFRTFLSQITKVVIQRSHLVFQNLQTFHKPPIFRAVVVSILWNTPTKSLKNSFCKINQQNQIVWLWSKS